MPLPKVKNDKQSRLQQYILDLAGLMARFKNEKTLQYLEVGAFDGIQFSNTLLLRERLGWSGLLVEPIKEYFELLCHNRPDDICINALLGSGKKELVQIRKAGPMSRAIVQGVGSRFSLRNHIKSYVRKFRFLSPGFSGGGIETLSTTSVNQICLENEIKQLHFISLDVEGMEHEVLRGIDFLNFDVLAVLVEARPHNMMPILETLLPAGFSCVEAMSRFNKQDDPRWDGTHQDYLFLRRDFMAWAENDHY